MKYRTPFDSGRRKDKTLQQVTKLHANQFSVFNNNARFRCLVAGRRFGKTVLSRTELVKAAAKPNSLVWYIAPTYRMARQIMWKEMKDAVPKGWVKKYHETLMEISLNNGSIISLKGADKPDSLLGVALDFVVFDEFQSMRPEVWDQAIRPTLATTGGGALFIGTPRAYNHLYKMYEKGQDPQNIRDGTFRSWQYVTADSPFIPPREIAMAKRELDPKTFAQEFMASFETMSGRVYYSFDRRIHAGDYKFDPKLPIWVGQDFNVDPMTSVICQWHKEKNELWVVDEIVLPNSNTEEAFKELERRYWKYKHQTVIYPDASGDNRSTNSYRSDLDIIGDVGYRSIKAKKKNPLVADRINSVNRMLFSADGTVRMRFDNDVTHTIRAMEQTIYEEGQRKVDKSDGVEHAADALGYLTNYEFPTRKFKVMGINI